MVSVTFKIMDFSFTFISFILVAVNNKKSIIKNDYSLWVLKVKVRLVQSLHSLFIYRIFVP